MHSDRIFMGHKNSELSSILIILQLSKNDSFDLEEFLQALPRKGHERLWNGLKKLCDDVLNMLSLNEDKEDDENCQQDTVCV